MTGRERFQAAFAFEEADRVPLDIAATASSEIEPAARARLLEHLGREPREDEDGLEELLDDPRAGRRPGSPRRHGAVADRELEPDLDALRREALRQREKGRAVVLDTEFGLVDGCQRLRGHDGLAGGPARRAGRRGRADGEGDGRVRRCAARSAALARRPGRRGGRLRGPRGPDAHDGLARALPQADQAVPRASSSRRSTRSRPRRRSSTATARSPTCSRTSSRSASTRSIPCRRRRGAWSRAA